MAPATTSPTDILLEFAEQWRVAPLPAEVEARTRQIVLDTLACYVGGTPLEAGKMLLAFAERSPGEVQLYPLSRAVSVEAASYAAASLGNLIDADDTLYNRGHHATAIVLPALIYGATRGSSVAELLRAVAVGFEVAARISLSWSYYTINEDGSVRGADVAGVSWIAPGLAISLGLERGMSSDDLRSAVGLAAYSVPIPTNSNWHLAFPLELMTKYCLYGAIAQSTISAVELAALGFKGAGRVMDGPHGFRRLIGATSWDDEVLATGIPGTWAICETALKRFPACRLWSGVLGALEGLVAKHDVRPDQVRRVEVRLALMHPSFRRLAQEYPALTEISAQFSVPYSCAQVLQRHEPGPSWYGAEALRSAETNALMRKIDVVADPVLNAEAAAEVRRVGHYGRRLPWAVSIEQTSGEVVSASGTNALGDPFVPDLVIPMAGTVEKYRQFYAQARGKPAPERLLGVLDEGRASCATLLAALAEE